MKTPDIATRYDDYLTTQQVFDLASHHLGTMERRCAGEDGICVYRGPNNNCCAAGFFLKDDEINASNNGKGINHLYDYNLVPTRLIAHLSILRSLQTIHDNIENWQNNRKNMRVMLEEHARFRRLDDSILNHPDMVWNIGKQQ